MDEHKLYYLITTYVLTATAHLELFKLLSFGDDAEDVGFCSLRVEMLIERLHMWRKEKRW